MICWSCILETDLDTHTVPNKGGSDAVLLSWLQLNTGNSISAECFVFFETDVRSAVRLIAGNLYTVHIQGSYVLDYLLVFLDHHIFSLYACVTLGAVCASCVRSCASASRCACVGIGDLSGVASVVMSGGVVSRGTSGG